jgi:hypothetical protein
MLLPPAEFRGILALHVPVLWFLFGVYELVASVNALTEPQVTAKPHDLPPATFHCIFA